MDQHVIKMFFIYAQIIIFITLTRTEMYVKHFKYKRIQRGLLRHLDTAALCWFIFKVICFLQPLFPSLPLSLTASVEKVLSSGICNFTDITVEQMASVHSPLNISLLHLSACSFTLPVAFSLTHALIQSLRLSLYGLSRGFISLAAFCLSFSLFPTAFLSSYILSLPVPLYLTCLMISKESFDPHENLHSSSTTYLRTGILRIPEDERRFTRIRGRHVASSEIH